MWIAWLRAEMCVLFVCSLPAGFSKRNENWNESRVL